MKNKEDKIKVSIEPVEGSWKRALNLARKTVGKNALDKEPSTEWKRKILLQEHSPIRVVEYIIHFEDIRQWVSVHLARHWLGFIPFVHSQRQDRRVLNCERDELPQGSLNDMDVFINAQSLINVSKKRLCRKASPETRFAWESVKNQMEKIDPTMASVMVPECVYRGFCPYKQFEDSCGYFDSQKGQDDRERYINGITIKEFIKQGLEDFVKQFPQACAKYEQPFNDHKIQIEPFELQDQENYIKWENDFWNQFVEKYPDEGLYFVDDDEIQNAEFIIQGKEYKNNDNETQSRL